MTNLFPDVCRKILKEFKEADVLLLSQMERIEVEAVSQHEDVTKDEEDFRRLFIYYKGRIQGEHVSWEDFRNIEISPAIIAEIEPLKSWCAEISKNEKELENIKKQLMALRKQLKRALQDEEDERATLERKRKSAEAALERERRRQEQEAFERKRKEFEEAIRRQKEEAAALERKRKEEQEAFDRKRKAREQALKRRVNVAVAAVCLLIALHALLLQWTTLSFQITVDGKPLRTDQVVHVTLDGKPFASGNRITIGRHHLSVELLNVVPIRRTFWSFYGANQLGVISLDSFKGGVILISAPPDAEFELSGNGQHWSGRLPTGIDSVPAGSYKLAVHRKGWELDQDVTVNRGIVSTNKTEFPYGSIEVTSEPAGLEFSVNGENTGKTPSTFREARPGQYRLSVSDGENDLTAGVTVGPNDAIKKSFVFQYGTARLTSSPAGATVTRNGKEIGVTPITLEHLAAGGNVMLDIQLAGYASTNFMFMPQAGKELDYSFKLFSRRYLEAMQQAQQALDAEQFMQASNLVATALILEAKDPSAIALAKDIAAKTEAWNEQQLAQQKLAAAEEARRQAAQLEALPALSPKSIMISCWNTDAEPLPSQYDEVGAAAMPIYVATEAAATGIKVVLSPLKLLQKKQPRFLEWKFTNKYMNTIYRYYGTIASIDAKNNTIIFTAYIPKGVGIHENSGKVSIPSGNTAKLGYAVTAELRHNVNSTPFPIASGTNVWVSGRLITLEEASRGFPAPNHIALDDCSIYPASISSKTNEIYLNP